MDQLNKWVQSSPQRESIAIFKTQIIAILMQNPTSSDHDTASLHFIFLGMIFRYEPNGFNVIRYANILVCYDTGLSVPTPQQSPSSYTRKRYIMCIN